MLAIWLHLGPPQKITKKSNLQPILKLFLIHMELELGVLGVAKKACERYISLINKISFS
jgi:hypothetical protein